ncbi:MerR family transcriptional regulator [Desulforhopalus sp. IMCC35007]|uniref:MerR family transcriptional regulator n=1 Tax=Desulforhopalus sp. IMCC35007 TaxID=2569543 RepID=UPI0010AE4AA8|nr:MerR family transcriptional regulator [Desulforhopalus sp. IMCC35007]TKB07148.1 MerR family transcriptional regulator [Desulforhopalus sp. IMCC35007]
MTITIPDKLYFKIGEVAQMAEVPTHVLRYWESEFSAIKPKRASSKQRLYRRQDVELILKIKVLLHEKGYTIAGARKLLQSGAAMPVRGQKKKKHLQKTVNSPLTKIKEELIHLQNLLNAKKD